MPAFEIPLTAEPQRLQIALGGTTYQLTLRWNAQSANWNLDIATDAGAEILNSIPLVTGTDLLAPYPYLNLGGQLIAQTLSDKTLVPSFGALGSSAKLYFVTS